MHFLKLELKPGHGNVHVYLHCQITIYLKFAAFILKQCSGWFERLLFKFYSILFFITNQFQPRKRERERLFVFSNFCPHHDHSTTSKVGQSITCTKLASEILRKLRMRRRSSGEGRGGWELGKYSCCEHLQFGSS